MKRIGIAVAVLVVCITIVLVVRWRARPDNVTIINSPAVGVFYTVETTYGLGPASSDYTNVYAHFRHGNKSDKKLVLSGDYVGFSKVFWTDPHNIVLCLSAELTNRYYNEVTLSADDAFTTIHNHLLEENAATCSDPRRTPTQ
jgi:hypothetical protein